jgi:hypothetical protein
MQIKSFQDYAKTRFTGEEIRVIEHQVQLEKQALQSLQDDIIQAMNKYMKQENIGFNEFAKRLQVSPTHVAKMKKGQANLTLLSVARFSVLLEKGPHLIFGKK